MTAIPFLILIGIAAGALLVLVRIADMKCDERAQRKGRG
jgi:hypothetical protein